jgi:hypothetical protein
VWEYNRVANGAILAGFCRVDYCWWREQWFRADAQVASLSLSSYSRRSDISDTLSAFSEPRTAVLRPFVISADLGTALSSCIAPASRRKHKL